MATPQSWCIVGGGLLGMTLAHRLTQSGFRVTLCESAPVLGGLASTWQLGNIEWDRHYHVILYSDLALRALLSELEIEDETEWTTTATGFFVNGSLHPFSSPLDLWRFPILGLTDKVRLVACILFASQVSSGTRFEGVTVEHWLRKFSGDRTFEIFWLPLLRSKLGDNYRISSAAFIWATIRRLFAARRAGIQERFGYVRGGYGKILRSFESLLLKEGVDIRLNCKASQVIHERGNLRVTFGDSSVNGFDRVVMTIPSGLAMRVCPQLSECEKSALQGIKYQGIICASLLLDGPLSPYYVTNIADPTVPLTGIIEMSNVVSRAEFGGESLVYLPKYLDPDDPLFEADDQVLKNMFLDGLRRVHPGFDPAGIRAFRLSRVRHVFAIPTLGYSSRLPPVETTVPGLMILNSSYIANGTLNVNEVVQLVDGAMPRFANGS